MTDGKSIISFVVCVFNPIQSYIQVSFLAIEVLKVKGLCCLYFVFFLLDGRSTITFFVCVVYPITESCFFFSYQGVRNHGFQLLYLQFFFVCVADGKSIISFF